MPELPEVEVLVRHLSPLLQGKTIRDAQVRRARVLGATRQSEFLRTLRGAKFQSVTRRGKYLLFALGVPSQPGSRLLVGHLGMTGRMYLAGKKSPLPKHAAVVLDLGKQLMIYEDTRYFGRLTLDTTGVEKLGPEPLGLKFTKKYLGSALKNSQQAIKVRLLDQTLIAGVGNIYASEALFLAGISPRTKSNRLTREQTDRLWRAIRQILAAAIRRGSTLPLSFSGNGARDGLFYYGGTEITSSFTTESLRVYNRNGQPCVKCATPIKRLVQAARSTFFCPSCQPAS